MSTRERITDMKRTTRRTFAQASALTALAATRVWGANDRINVAVIGVAAAARITSRDT
jgi:hypothetical protein